MENWIDKFKDIEEIAIEYIESTIPYSIQALGNQFLKDNGLNMESVQDSIIELGFNPREEKITYELIGRLKRQEQSKDFFRHKCHVEYKVPRLSDSNEIETKANSVIDAELGSAIGSEARMDFVICIEDEELEEYQVEFNEIYLGFEAKKLNYYSSSGKLEKNVDKYVSFGVCDFVSGKYSAEFPMGCMLGYVMNGVLAGLQKDIISELNKPIHDTKFESGPDPLHNIGQTERFGTIHKRNKISDKIAIRHTLLDCLYT